MQDNVFINCPFDREYRDIHRAIIFAVVDCGYKPRSADEADNAGQTRIAKISQIISECDLGIHDLSRNGADEDTGYARFNMPLELGIFLGASWLGTRAQKNKNCLIFESTKYEYQKYCSDIAGQDIKAHDGKADNALAKVRNWLNTASDYKLPGPKVMWKRYAKFSVDLPYFLDENLLDDEDLTFPEYRDAVFAWVTNNADFS